MMNLHDILNKAAQGMPLKSALPSPPPGNVGQTAAQSAMNAGKRAAFSTVKNVGQTVGNGVATNTIHATSQLARAGGSVLNNLSRTMQSPPKIGGAVANAINKVGKSVAHDPEAEKALYLHMLATAMSVATGQSQFSLDTQINALIGKLTKLREDKDGREALQNAIHLHPHTKAQIAQSILKMKQGLQHMVPKGG